MELIKFILLLSRKEKTPPFSYQKQEYQPVNLCLNFQPPGSQENITTFSSKHNEVVLKT